ncbi:hypothetical protein ACLK19_04745 [Escherichia coli]
MTAVEGLDIVVGVVETHGRKDTAAMLEGLAACRYARPTVGGTSASSIRCRPRPPSVLI